MGSLAGVGRRLVLPALAALLVTASAGAAGPDHPPVPAGPGGFVASDTCLTCHDGVLGRNVRVQNARDPFRFGSAPSAIDRERRDGHPIGMSYALVQGRRQSRLRPTALLEPAITLEGGRVGCVSCHDIESSRRARLVSTTARGGLCFACHEM